MHCMGFIAVTHRIEICKKEPDATNPAVQSLCFVKKLRCSRPDLLWADTNDTIVIDPRGKLIRGPEAGIE